MRVSQRKFVGGRTPWLVIAGLAGVLLLVLFTALQLRPTVALAKRQASLLDGIERRSPPRIQRLVADDYTDRWGFTREDIVATMVDAGGQFLALVVTPEATTTRIDDQRAEITMRLVISGKPVGPAANEVTRQINQLKEPFVFTWEKKSFLPSSWRLVRVENPGLPDELYGYEPGDIGRAMREE